MKPLDDARSAFGVSGSTATATPAGRCPRSEPPRRAPPSRAGRARRRSGVRIRSPMSGAQSRSSATPSRSPRRRRRVGRLDGLADLTPRISSPLRQPDPSTHLCSLGDDPRHRARGSAPRAVVGPRLEREPEQRDPLAAELAEVTLELRSPGASAARSPRSRRSAAGSDSRSSRRAASAPGCPLESSCERPGPLVDINKSQSLAPRPSRRLRQTDSRRERSSPGPTPELRVRGGIQSVRSACVDLEIDSRILSTSGPGTKKQPVTARLGRHPTPRAKTCRPWTWRFFPTSPLCDDPQLAKESEDAVGKLSTHRAVLEHDAWPDPRRTTTIHRRAKGQRERHACARRAPSRPASGRRWT